MPSSDRFNSPVRRTLLGVFGLLFLGVGLYFTWYPPQSASSQFLQGSCLKSGLVLLAAWLAYPQLDRLPGWLFGSLVLFLLAAAARPKIVLAVARLGLFLVPIFILIWALRPRPRRR